MKNKNKKQNKNQPTNSRFQTALKHSVADQRATKSRLSTFIPLEMTLSIQPAQNLEENDCRKRSRRPPEENRQDARDGSGCHPEPAKETRLGERKNHNTFSYPFSSLFPFSLLRSSSLLISSPLLWDSDSIFWPEFPFLPFSLYLLPPL